MSSGPIRMVIAVPDPIDFDDVDLVAVLADASVPSGQRLNDRDYFDSEVGIGGLVELLGIREWEDLAPGLWLVEGCLWHETDYYGEHDGGFEVDRAEPLTDVMALVRDWVRHEDDLVVVKDLAEDLLRPESAAWRRVRARQRLNEMEATLSVLRDCMERQADRDEVTADPAAPLVLAGVSVSVQMPTLENAGTIKLERPRCASCGAWATHLVCEATPYAAYHPETGLRINGQVPGEARPYCAACAAAQDDEGKP